MPGTGATQSGRPQDTCTEEYWMRFDNTDAATALAGIAGGATPAERLRAGGCGIPSRDATHRVEISGRNEK